MDLIRATEKWNKHGFTSIKSSIRQNGFISNNILIRQKCFSKRQKFRQWDKNGLISVNSSIENQEEMSNNI
jgi:hypothetical protein